MAKYQQYKEYKDSGVEWLGDVPKHWLITTFKRVIKEHSGNGFPIELQGDESGVIPFLKVSDINGTNKYSDRCNNRISNDSLNKYGWNLVPRGSIVTGKIGEALRKNHRKILSEDSVIDNNCIGIEPIHLTENYNFYVHKVIDFDWYVNGGAIPSISVQKYKAEVIAIPNENEQTQIANFLDHETAKIDSLIEQQQQLIHLLKEKRQAVISHAVTKGLNPNVPMKDSGVEWLGQVPEHWNTLPLKLCVQTRKGVAFKALDFCDAGIRVVKASDIKQKTIRESETFLPNSYVNEFPKAVLHTDDLILSTVGSTPDVKNSAVGQIGKVPQSLSGSLLNQNTVVFSSTEILDQNFLYYLVQTDSYRDHLDLNAHGTANQASLNISDMLNFMISIPELNEQVEIKNYLDKKISKLEELELKILAMSISLNERRTALISAAVTGKIDVRKWQNPTEAKTEFGA